MVPLEFTFSPMIGELFVVPLLGGLDKPNLKKKQQPKIHKTCYISSPDEELFIHKMRWLILNELPVRRHSNA